MGQNVKKLAGKIAGIANEQSEIKDNLTAEEPGAALNLFFKQQIRPSGHITLTKKFFPDDSFILDHPVYGELDSPTLKLDGGYSGEEILWL